MPRIRDARIAIRTTKEKKEQFFRTAKKLKVAVNALFELLVDRAQRDVKNHGKLS